MESNIDYKNAVQNFFTDVNHSLTIPELGGDPDETKIFENVSNRGDGHCFYHTVLRFINDYRQYFQEHGPLIVINGEHKTVDNLIPNGYDPEQQEAKDIYLLRKSLLENYPDRYSFSPNLYNDIQGKYFYLQALYDSWENEGTSNYAGDGIAGTMEFMDMANMLNICMVIWNPDFGAWSLYLSTSDIQKGLENCGRGDANIANSQCCPLVLFINNKNKNHFDTLIPTPGMSENIEIIRKKIIKEQEDKQRKEAVERSKREAEEQRSMRLIEELKKQEIELEKERQKQEEKDAEMARKLQEEYNTSSQAGGRKKSKKPNSKNKKSKKKRTLCIK